MLDVVRSFSLAFLALVLTGCQAESPDPSATDDPHSALAEIVAGQGGLHPGLSGLQIVVLRGGEIVSSPTFGFARLTEQGQDDLRTDHKVRVASISKLVTAIGVMQLVEQGRVDLDDDVSDWLGFNLRNPKFPDDPITVRQLLAHTSSIRDGGRYWLLGEEVFSDFFLPDGALFGEGAYFADDHAPGSYFAYSNLGFGVLAGVIEVESGMRFDAYMRENVLLPLGLDIGFSPCDVTRRDPELLAATFRKTDEDDNWTPDGPWRAQNDGEMVACYVGMDRIPRAGDQPVSYLADYKLGQNPTYFSPQGGLRASAEDLATITQMLLNRGSFNGVDILKAETVDAMLAPVWTYDPALQNGAHWGEAVEGGVEDGLMTSYGLSVHIADLKEWGLTEESQTLYGHLATAYGLLGQLWFDPDTKDGVIILLTGTDDDPAASTPGSSPLYRVEEEILRWWVREYRSD